MTVEEKELTVSEEDVGLGFEDMSNQDFSAPFLVIVQGLSPYIDPTHSLYVPEAKLGLIINTQNNSVYDEINVIPCKFSFKRVEWRPRNQGGGFVASYSRTNAPDDIYVSDPIKNILSRKSTGNEIIDTAYYLCLLVDENFERVIIPMHRTKLKVSRSWNSLMEGQKVDGKTLPIFGNVYRLSVIQESKKGFNYYSWKVSLNCRTIELDKEIYNLAKETHAIGNFLPEKLLESISQTTDSDVL